MTHRRNAAIGLWPAVLLTAALITLAGCQGGTRAPEAPPPTGNVPTGNAPSGNAPIGNAPTGNGPAANAPTGEAPPQGAAPAPQTERIAEIENEIFRRINQIRREHGLQALERNETLDQVARQYSRTMSQANRFSHIGPQGSTPFERIENAGLRYRIAAENLFKSFNVPQPVDAAVSGWMDSEGHRKNILREGVTQTGVGVWKEGNTFYFTQEFMRPM